MALLGERYSDTNYSKPLLGCTARSSWQMRWQSMSLAAVWLACSKKEYEEYPTFTSAQSTKRKSGRCRGFRCCIGQTQQLATDVFLAFRWRCHRGKKLLDILRGKWKQCPLRRGSWCTCVFNGRKWAVEPFPCICFDCCWIKRCYLVMDASDARSQPWTSSRKSPNTSGLELKEKYPIYTWMSH